MDVDDVEDNVKRKRQKVDDKVDWANKKETSSSYGLPDSDDDDTTILETDFLSHTYNPTPVSRESASSASSSSSLKNNSQQVISLVDSDSDGEQHNNVVEKQQPDVVDLT